MRRHTRSRAWLAILPLVLTTASCSSDPPAPADQFKTISDGKKAQLTQFLEGKQSRLGKYTATVTEEPDVDKRADHTHVGRIEFQYAVTLPKGESQVQYLEAAEADYHFSTKEKKWVYKGCFPMSGLGSVEPKDGPLVTFAEVKAAFEGGPG